MRSPVRIAVVVVMIMILGSAFVSRAASPAAQQATPPVGSIGVGGGAVGSGAPIAAPGQLLSLRRGVFEPGASFRCTITPVPSSSTSNLARSPTPSQLERPC